MYLSKKICILLKILKFRIQLKSGFYGFNGFRNFHYVWALSITKMNENFQKKKNVYKPKLG